MVSFGATAAGLFWTVNVWPGTSTCNKQGQRSGGSIFFMVFIPMLLKFAESYV